MPSASLRAFRAVSAIILKKLLHPLQFMAVILLVAGYALTVFLSMSFSAWWWLLLIILVPLTIVFLIAKLISVYLLRIVTPRRLSDAEQGKITAFADKLFSVAERTQTPYPVMLFLIGRDVVRRRESEFLRNLVGDSKSLMTEFGEIQELFRE